MKWILIGTKTDSEKISMMREFFSNEKIDNEEFVADDESFSLDLEKIWSVSSETAYCVFLSADKINESKDLVFLFGGVSSLKVPTFFLDNGKLLEGIANSEKIPDTFSCFSDFTELFNEVKKQIPILKAAENRKAAYTSLFNKGLPFTADIFSFAIANAKLDICNLYLTAGMDINSVDSNGTPMLNIAVRNDSFEMVDWVLKNGADINAVSSDRGYTAVMDAVWRKNVKLTKFLIERGAKLEHISKEGQSILVLAVGNGNAEICELLLANGADSEVKDMMGESARGYANLFKNKAVMEVFEKYPAKK